MSGSEEEAMLKEPSQEVTGKSNASLQQRRSVNTNNRRISATSSNASESSRDSYRRKLTNHKAATSDKYRRNSPKHYSKPSTSTSALGTASAVSSAIMERFDQSVPIHQMARDGDYSRLKKVLRSVDEDAVLELIKRPDEQHLTALHYAARYNHMDIVKLLISYGADVNVQGEEGITPLHFAARYKRIHQSPGHDLDKQGQRSKRSVRSHSDEEIADVEEPKRQKRRTSNEELSPTRSQSDYDRTASEEAEAQGIISYLVEKGADINDSDQYGLRPLHYAAIRSNDVVAQELLKHRNILVDAFDEEGMTPLHAACAHGAVSVTKMLLRKGANMTAVDEQGNTPAHLAAQEGHVHIMELLMQQAEKMGKLKELITAKEYENNTVFHLAVDSGHYQIAHMLLEKGSDVNTTRKLEETPLHAACVAGRLKVVKLLLDHGAELDVRTHDEETPLHKAAQYNHYKIVTYLLQKGASKEVKNKDGCTPFLLACTEGHAKTVSTLMVSGADADSTDKFDRTGLFLAAQHDNYEVVEVLLKSSYKHPLINRSDRYNNTPLHVAAEKGYLETVTLLLKEGADIDAKNEQERTPMHLASINGRGRVIREMLSHGNVIVNDEDEESNTPLHLAALSGHESVIVILLENGADICSRNSYLWTAVDCAAAKGWVQSVHVLLDWGAPIDPVDKTKTTPLHLACKEGHLDVVQLLLARGANVSLLDSKDHNCLDLAVINNRRNVALAIINHEDWKKALHNPRYENGHLHTPLRSLILHLPDVARAVLDRCTETNDRRHDDRDFEIRFNYEFLEDTVDICEKLLNEDTEKTNIVENDVEFWQKKLRRRQSHTDKALAKKVLNSDFLINEHPLSIMVENERESLLGHPIVLALLRYKWNHGGRWVYYITLLLYVIFLIFLTLFIIEAVPPYKYQNTDVEVSQNSNASTAATANASPVTNPPEDKENPLLCLSDELHTSTLAFVSRYAVLLVLIPLHLTREIYQFYRKGWKYLGGNNIMEVTVYVTSLILVWDVTGKCYITSWQWQLGAITVCLAWLGLVLFLQKFPRWGIFVVMIKDILATFSRFFFVFFLFLVAFALSFHMLLGNQLPFRTFGTSLLKTFVMMIGEMEFDSIFNNDWHEHLVYYDGVTYAVFVSFLIVMTIIIANLLIGLAVDDIKGVQDKARLKKLGMQVELVLEVEMGLPHSLRKCLAVDRETIRPNRKGKLEKLWSKIVADQASALSHQTIAKALRDGEVGAEQTKADIETLSHRIGMLERRNKQVIQQNQQLKSMLTSLLQKLEVHWEEEDAMSFS